MNILHTIKEYFAGRLPDRRGGALEARSIVANWSREELEQFVAAMFMDDFKEQGTRSNWFTHYLVEKHERERLKNLLASTYHNDKELNRAIHVADLEAKVKTLKSQLRWMQEAAERRNREAWATGLIVHCTGCEAGAPFNAEELTEEKVQAVEGVANRLRIWWRGHQGRVARGKA